MTKTSKSHSRKKKSSAAAKAAAAAAATATAAAAIPVGGLVGASFYDNETQRINPLRKIIAYCIGSRALYHLNARLSFHVLQRRRSMSGIETPISLCAYDLSDEETLKMPLDAFGKLVYTLDTKPATDLDLVVQHSADAAMLLALLVMRDPKQTSDLSYAELDKIDLKKASDARAIAKLAMYRAERLFGCIRVDEWSMVATPPPVVEGYVVSPVLDVLLGDAVLTTAAIANARRTHLSYAMQREIVPVAFFNSSALQCNVVDLRTLAALKAAQLVVPHKAWAKHFSDYAEIQHFWSDGPFSQSPADFQDGQGNVMPHPQFDPAVFASHLVHEVVRLEIDAAVRRGAPAGTLTYTTGDNEIGAKVEVAGIANQMESAPHGGKTASNSTDDAHAVAFRDASGVFGCTEDLNAILSAGTGPAELNHFDHRAWCRDAFYSLSREEQTRALRVRIAAIALVKFIVPLVNIKINKKRPGVATQLRFAQRVWMGGLEALVAQPTNCVFLDFDERLDRRLAFGAIASRAAVTAKDISNDPNAWTKVQSALRGAEAQAHRVLVRKLAEETAQARAYQDWIDSAWLRFAVIANAADLVEAPREWTQFCTDTILGRGNTSPPDIQAVSLLLCLPKLLLKELLYNAHFCVADLACFALTCKRSNDLVSEPCLWLQALVDASHRAVENEDNRVKIYAIGWHPAVKVDLETVYGAQNLKPGGLRVSVKQWQRLVGRDVNWRYVARDLLADEQYVVISPRRMLQNCIHCAGSHVALTSDEHLVLMSEFGDDEGYMEGFCCCEGCYEQTGSWSICEQHDEVVGDDIALCSLRAYRGRNSIPKPTSTLAISGTLG